MKIVITNDEHNIAIAKDFSGMDKGLLAQTMIELEILKEDLLEIYLYPEDNK